MSKYALVSCLAVILLAVACSDEGDKPTDPVVVVPSISVGDYAVIEGGTALFPVTLDKTTTRAVTFSYATIAGTATVGVDFLAATGSDTIPAGQTGATVLVATLDDSDLEAVETYSLALSVVAGAEVADALATGTINDNETGFVSYASQVAPILDGSCALPNLCHGPGSTSASLLYIDDGASYDVVINAIGLFTEGKVIVPGSASTSTLYISTTAAAGGGATPYSRMPDWGLDTLTTVQQHLLRDWINQGALDN